MKKSCLWIVVLILIDQIIKLFIARFLFDINFVLIPDILYFRPIQNTNLNWIASIYQYTPPIYLMVFIQLFALVNIILAYRYLTYVWIKGVKLLNSMCIFVVSAIACSFIDVVFWGGSLDFIQLFDWFIFDLKDLYSNIGLIFLIYFSVLYYFKAYLLMSKEERKQTELLPWIKKGMPSKRTE